MTLLGGDPIRRKCCLGIPQPTHATNRVWINPFVASCVGWPSVQVPSTVRQASLGNFPTRTAADRGVSTTVYLTGLSGLWRLVRAARGMALKRGCVLAGAAVLEAVPGPWGSSQTLIKVLPGRSAARAGLGELTGRQDAGSDTALIAVPPAETGLGDRDE